MSLLAKVFVEHILAFIDGIVSVLLFQPLADLVSRRTALGDLQPVDARAGSVRGCDDLNDIAVLQLVVDGDHLAVDFRADTFAADIGMDLESEVQRR